MEAAPGSSTRRRVALTITILGFSVFAVYIGLWLALIVGGHTEQADYTAFYTGWTIVADGHGQDLYDIGTQTATQQAILGGRSFEAGLNPFNNPPHLVVPFVPLAALPMATQLPGLGRDPDRPPGLARLAALVRGRGRRGRARSGWPWSRSSLAASPLIITFLQGAFSLLACVAVVEAYLALRRSRDGRAGAWLVLATIKPQAVADARRHAPRRATLARDRRRPRWSPRGLGLLATVVLGPAIWGDYLRFLSRYVSTFDELSVRPSVMWNIRGTLTLLIGPDHAAEQAGLINGLAFAGQILGLAGVAWLWRGRWSPTTPDFDLRFALTIVIGLLTSAHLNPHDDLLLVPAAAIAYRAPARAARGRSGRAAPGRRDVRRAHRQRDQRQRRRGPADPRPGRADGRCSPSGWPGGCEARRARPRRRPSASRGPPGPARRRPRWSTGAGRAGDTPRRSRSR